MAANPTNVFLFQIKVLLRPLFVVEISASDDSANPSAFTSPSDLSDDEQAQLFAEITAKIIQAQRQGKKSISLLISDVGQIVGDPAFKIP
jgi:hypothetical protein